MALLQRRHCSLTVGDGPCLRASKRIMLQHSARRCPLLVRASADADSSADEPPTIMGDWREFRAKLISEAGAGPMWATRVAEENKRLLEEQTPYLASEELWAHATAGPEAGGLLLATLQAPAIIGEQYWQAVVFVVAHSSRDGSVGLLLNRPAGLTMGRKRGGLPFDVVGAQTHMQNAFQDNRIYCGGFTAQQVLHILHGHKLPGAVEIVPGVFMGGQDAATDAVHAGELQANDFKFFSGALAWPPGLLQEEVNKGAWYTAAASRPIVLKQCLQLPKPLWREVLELMGGEHAAVATEAYRRLQQPEE